MKILLAGDSYAADWSDNCNHYASWHELLSEKINCNNVAQAGVSEYKIHQQIEKNYDPMVYDFVIVTHTSPFRIHTAKHPFHCGNSIHNSADLIFSDVDYFINNVNSSDPAALCARDFFIYHFDQEYFTFTYKLIRDSIRKKLQDTNYLFIDFFENSYYHSEENRIDVSDIAKQNKGNVCHMNAQGNLEIAEKVYNLLIGN